MFAIEFALLAPLCVSMLGWGLDIYQQTMQVSAAQFTAQASAVVGARLLKQQPGNIIAATQAAQKAFAGNSSAFILGSTGTLGTVAALDANGTVTSDDTAAVSLRVSVSASAAALFPLLIGPTISTTAQVQS